MNDGFVEKLRAALGADNVLSGRDARFVYSYDAALDKREPLAVALPRDAAQAAAAVRLAREAGVPFTARGAGTNLCGGSVAAEGGLVIHLARLNRILAIDPARRRARLEPGVVNLHLQKALEPHGLFYAPDPASQKACTLGGNVGTNAGGPHCLKHGVTTNHVAALTLVLPDGGTARVSVDDAGPDLAGLFVGSEGTLGVVTEIEVRLLPLPQSVKTMLVAFPSMEAAAQAVTDVIAAGVTPTTLEVMDRITVEAVEAFVRAGYPKGAEAVLLIEADGAAAEVERDARRILELCAKNGSGEARVAKDEAERQKLWEGRRGAYPAMARLAPNVLVEDGVVPRTRLPEAVRRIRAIAARENLRMGLIAHAGDGNLHPNMIFDERDEEQTRRVKAAGYEMLKVCVDLGGSISGEHGIGTDKREAMKWLFTPATLRAFRRIKERLDPGNLCNPGKLIPVTEEPAPVAPAARPPSGTVSPATVAELQGLLAAAARDKAPVYLKGTGTKGFVPPPGAAVVSLAGLARVVENDVDNFTVTVQAGATAESLAAALAPSGRHARVAGRGTLGGLVASRAGDAPRLRDEIVGLKAVLADGQLVAFGGKVVKNVAGYDAAKLFIGSWGAFGAIVELTLRTYPFPPETAPAPAPKPDFAWSRAPLARRIKSAFDPDNLLNPSVFA